VKLSPDNRESLLATLTPPPGYRVEAALGTTYTLDLEALTAALLTLAGFEWPEGGESKVPTSKFIGARLALRERFRVLFDQGRLSTGRLRPDGIQRANLLDRFLVARQQKSAFHPKVWVVKFVPEEKGAADLYRLLCASRNLTASASWELAVMMEGVGTNQTHQIGNAAADLLAASTKGTTLPKPVLALLAELKRVEFSLQGTQPEQVEFHGQWPQGISLWNHLPAVLSSAVVVAPFVEAPFLSRLRERCDGRILVLSTLATLAPLKDDVERLGLEAYVIREVLNDQDFGLHAKLLLFESGGKEFAYLGSANATKAAWGMSGRNTEAVMCLTDVIRIDQFVKSFADPKNELVRWLQCLDEADFDLAEIDQDLKNAARAVRQDARFEVRYDAKRGVLIVKALKLPRDVTVMVRPLTVADGTAQGVSEGQSVEFSLPRAALTRVLVLTVGLPGQPVTEELVFVVDVLGASDSLFDMRDGAFDAKDPAALEQALLHLFAVDGGGGGSEDEDDTSADPPTQTEKSAGGGAVLLSRITLERILRSCSTRPDTADMALRMIDALPPERARVLGALIRRVQEARYGHVR
jgi:hypothetical protein